MNIKVQNNSIYLKYLYFLNVKSVVKVLNVEVHTVPYDQLMHLSWLKVLIKKIYIYNPKTSTVYKYCTDHLVYSSF